MAKKSGYKDPLETKGVGAEYFGTMSAKLEYDADYGRKFYTIMYTLLAALFGGLGAIFSFTWFYYIAGAMLVFALFTLIFYKTWKNYDIASSRVYCEKRYPPGTSKEKIRECLFDREKEERLQGGGSGSGIGDAIFYGSLAYFVSN